MNRKLVLATALCLAVAALGIGAAPAVAADGCECHTAAEPTATPAHALLVAGVTDCATCHVGMTVPHTGQVTQAIFFYRGRPVAAGYRLNGQAYDILMLGKGVKRVGVTIYLQQRAPGETVFADIGQATTNRYGNFGYTVTAPVPYAYYRAVAQGQIVPSRIALPCIRDLAPTPMLTLALRGLTRGAVARGHGVTARGRARPAGMAGEAVRFEVQKQVKAKFIPLTTVNRTCSAAAAYSWTYKAKAPGLYRVRAVHPRSEDYAGARSPWRQFRVR
jgi:hypothetical protein